MADSPHLARPWPDACALRSVLPYVTPADRRSIARTCRWWRLVSSDLALGLEPAAVRFDARALPPFPYFSYEQGLRMSAEEWEDGELEGCDCALGECGVVEHCPCARHACGHGLVECGSACSCARAPDRCRLRAVGSGPRPELSVCRTGDARGWGVCATQPVQAGALVCEYGGQTLSARRARKIFRAHDRARARNDTSPFFLMSVREEVGAASARRTIRSFIDARWVGSVGRFINHSCAPCLEARTVRIGHVTPRVAFFATRAIASGEEISYSYGEPGDERAIALPCSLPQLVRQAAPGGDAGSTPVPCLCGSTACRRVLPSS